MPKPYRLILFDCVNTLYLPDPSRMPRIEVDGKALISTAALLHERLAPLRPALTVADVYHATRRAMRWAVAERGEALREVPAPRRFARLCAELALADAEPGLPEALLEVHMAAVTAGFRFPAAHRAALEQLRGDYRLALLSNFDHGPALQRLLEREGIAGWFDPLLISDGLGYRKPGAAAFAEALRRIGEPPQLILFVGDSVEDDVEGGNAAGLDVAWINPARAAPPAHSPPAYEVPSVAALPPLL